MTRKSHVVMRRQTGTLQHPPFTFNLTLVLASRLEEAESGMGDLCESICTDSVVLRLKINAGHA